jgi:2-aminoadipate transaminase
VFLGVLEGIGARAIPVKTDDSGMCPDALEETLKQLEDWGELDRVKMIYLVSYYENPSGVSLATDRRPRMVEIAQKWSKHHRIMILEDAAYRELRYDGEEYPSIWGCDKSRQNVILTQTFSKSYSPGLRVGFGILPEDLVKPVCDRKGNEDFGSANLNQHIIAHVLSSGQYQNHVEKVRQSYRVKRDAMLRAADKYFTDLPGVSWVHPHGGLYVWMTVPEHIQTGFASPLFEIATRQEKVMYVPGELCFAGTLDHRPHNSMRLSYGVQSPEGIDLGMKRLSNALKAVM